MVFIEYTSAYSFWYPAVMIWRKRKNSRSKLHVLWVTNIFILYIQYAYIQLKSIGTRFIYGFVFMIHIYMHRFTYLYSFFVIYRKESRAFITCLYKKHRSFRHGRTNICSFRSIWRSITLLVVLQLSWNKKTLKFARKFAQVYYTAL